MKTNSKGVYSTQFDLLEDRMTYPNADDNSTIEIKSSDFTFDHDGLYDPSDDLAELHWLASFLEEPLLDKVLKPPISPCFGSETKDMDVIEQISDGFRSSSSISAIESSSCSGNIPTYVPHVSPPGKVKSIRATARVPFSNWGTGSLPLLNSNPVRQNGPNICVSTDAAVSTHSDSLSSQQVKYQSSNRLSRTDREIETNCDDATRVIKCMKCGTRKPPHWIDGPKTLCVACHAKYNTSGGHLHHSDCEQEKCHISNKVYKRNQGIRKKEQGKLHAINKFSKRNQGIKKKERGKLDAIKCMHCGIIKTPQWRDGPMGPKTLCNACGVRYRAGKLLPEYRPAASPTFSANEHSNCHQKVLEIRSQKELAAQIS